MIRHLRRYAWRALALLALVLAILGIVLPVLPTVPFVLLSAWAAEKGWPEFEVWLLHHRYFGPPIKNWRARGIVPRKAKWLASLMMLGSALLLWLSSLAWWLKLGVISSMLIVAVWLWRRPE